MPTTFQHATLDNRLTIIAETDPDAHSAALGYFVKAGARDETSDIMGVSHFLEHMVFKGTDALDAAQLNQAFDDIGARNNAYTTAELTCYYASVMPQYAPQVNTLIASMLRPALRTSDFDTEKGVILEEIAMYNDNPFWVLYEKLMEAHFPTNPLAHRVLGTNETITALTAEQMRTYFASRYAPDNIVLAAAGNIDFDALAAQTADLTASWTPAAPAFSRTTPAASGDRIVLRDDSVTRAYSLFFADGPGIGDDRRYAAALAAQILGIGDNARLHWALIETGLAEEAQASYEPHDGIGSFSVFVTCDPDRIEDVWAVVEREADQLADTITDDDLAKIRSRLVTGVTLSGERPAGRMQRLGRQWTYLRDYTTLEQELERLSAVTVSDIKAVLADFPLSKRTTGWLIPE